MLGGVVMLGVCCHAWGVLPCLGGVVMLGGVAMLGVCCHAWGVSPCLGCVAMLGVCFHAWGVLPCLGCVTMLVVCVAVSIHVVTFTFMPENMWRRRPPIKH